MTDLPSKVTLSKLGQNQRLYFDVTEKTPWGRELLEELNELHDQEIHVAPPAGNSLHAELELERKHSTKLGDYLLLHVDMNARYLTSCIRCLIPMEESLQVSFDACAINKEYANEPEHKDQATIYLDDRERELYFFENNQVDIKEIMHEQIFLAKNPLPIHSPDCKGLCQICGTNLNHELCVHMKN